MTRHKRTPPDPLPIEPYLRQFVGVEGFLRAIAEEPRDDTHRLILADWLEEHGAMERAEFIRCQCREAVTAGWLRPVSLGNRIRRLRDAHASEWRQDLSAHVEAERGLYTSLVTGTPGATSEYLQEIGDAADVHRLIWQRCGITSWQQHFANFPIPRGLTSLDLSDNYLHQIPLTFGSSADLSDLDELVLKIASLTDADLASLCHNIQAPLRTLDLSGNMFTGNGLRHLVEASFATNLRQLRINHVAQLDEGISFAGESSLLAGLEQLELFGCRLNDNPNGVGVLGLICSSFFGGLRELSLGANALDAPAIELFAEAGGNQLQVLDLGDNALGNAGVVLLAAAHLVHLRALSVHHNDITDVGVAALARAEDLAGLTALSIGRNPLGDAGVVALAGSPVLAGLTTIGLRESMIGSDGAQALALSRHLTRLRALNLNGNHLGSAGVAALARSANSRGLEALSLSNNGIGDDGAKAIAGSPHLAGLGSLLLDNNRLGAAGLRALVESPYLRNLYVLSLRDNPGLRSADPGMVRARWPFAEL